LVLVAFWSLATVHCRLEQITGLEFLVCHSDSNFPSQQNSDCGDTGCCTAEKSQYRSGQIRVTIPSPDLLPVVPVEFAVLTRPEFKEANPGAVVTESEKLCNCWQFVFRTASAPRAPSLAS
jgi:hypothetical protein